jgi:6-pyruvoyltetrahydropterin/6-carboxytetrahydropterin synthase
MLQHFIALLALVALTGASSVSEGFNLGIRDSIMIAHSFTEEFGPAHGLHGATYTVDVEFSSKNLVKGSNWVIDIGEASNMLSEVLKEYNFKHLNELFPTENTTTEFMCKVIHRDMCGKLKQKSWRGGLTVKLHESHKAWASFSRDV